MMEPSSYHSSTSGGDDSLMSVDDSVSINDDGFLSNFESEYDSGLDTSYSDFSSCATASTTSSFSIAKEDLRDDDSHEGYRDTTMTPAQKKDIEEEPAAIMSAAYNHNEESFFDSLRSLNDGIDSLTTGLSPPSLPRPSLAATATAAAQTSSSPSSSPSTPPSANNQNNRRSSIGSMFESLLCKPISSIGTIGSISNFDFKEAFPPLPLTDCFSRQVTPTTAAKVKQGPDPPPPIPEFKPFKDGYGESPSRTISEDTDDLMDMDIDLEETLSSNETSKPSPAEEKKEAALKPPPPPPAPTEITPPEPSRRKKRSSSSHKKSPAGTSSSSAAAATSKRRVSSQSSASSKKKRRKRPNQKKRQRRTEPEVKKFVSIISSKDVLMGRGGRSNHHEGNEVYRKRILNLQKTYKTLSRDEKTQMSKDVVQWILKRGGKFLQKDEGGSWYVATVETARQKVSQALREDHTLEGRMLKKSRTTCFKQQSQKKKKNPPPSSNASV